MYVYNDFSNFSFKNTRDALCRVSFKNTIKGKSLMILAFFFDEKKVCKMMQITLYNNIYSDQD